MPTVHTQQDTKIIMYKKSRKFFDIIPPEHEEAEKRIKLLKVEKNKEVKTNRIKLSLKKKVIFFILVFILISLFLNSTLSQARIEIWPVTEDLNFEEEIIIDAKSDEFNPTLWLKNKVIPGKFFEEIKEDEQEFSASKEFEKEEKAKGKIKVFNKYNPPIPLALKAGTHFLSSDGKYFYCPERIYIPAAKIENKKIIPGSVEIEIIAKESGKEYNIGATTF